MTVSAVAPHPDRPWTLADVMGVETLQAIQDAFARAFGLPTVIIDTSGRNITEITHRVAFCEDLTRPSTGGVRCATCDADAMHRAESTGQPAIFRCWNSLYDCAIPIVSGDGRLFGHFLCGQVFLERHPIDGYRKVAREIGADEDAYVAAAGDIRVVSRGQFERAIEAMGVLARMIADQASASMQNLAILEQALEAKAQTDRLTRELDTIVEASAAIAASGDSLPTLERIADSIGRVVPCDSCIIFELDSGGRRLRPLTVRDPYADAIANWRPELGVGIPGLVAQSGTALRIEDVRADSRFVPIPDVPVEPEAILAVPMLFNGEVTGVITASRFQRRRFSNHELDVLKILAAQSAIALATAASRDDAARRLAAERAQAGLAHRINLGGPLAPLLDELLATAHRLLSCSSAALRMDDADLARAVRPIGIIDRSLDAVVQASAAVGERARTARRPVACTHDGAAMLVVPVEAAGLAVGELFLSRSDPFSDSDIRVAAALARQAGAATENAGTERSVRRMRAGYTLLAELAAKISASRSRDAIVDVVVRRAHELIGGEAGFAVLLNAPADEIDAFVRTGGRNRRVHVSTGADPRLRLPQLVGETSGYREELLAAWGLAVAEALDWPPGTHAATAPLIAQNGQLLGAVVVVGAKPFGEDEHKLLSVVAHSASAALTAWRAEQTTDATLRARVAGLTALTTLGQRITACQEPEDAVTAMLSALPDLAHVSGAALLVRLADSAPKVRGTVGFSRARAARLVAGLPEDVWDAVDPVRTETALAIPLLSSNQPRGLIVASLPSEDPDDAVLLALARYGTIALDNAERLEGERKSLAESRKLHHGSKAQAGELERSLAIQRALSEAVLDRRGLASVTETLVKLQGGRVTIYDADLQGIAGFPDPPAKGQPIAEFLAREADGGVTAPLEIELAEGEALMAVPIQAEGERLGWMVQQLPRALGEVDRAAVTHAASAAALAMLRLRAAEEAETRMRGEFLESLLAGEASPEDLVRHGRALTFDLARPSRVVVVAATVESPESTERLYHQAVSWTRSARGSILVAKRGNELTVLGPDEDGWPGGLHAALVQSVGSVLVGVGPVAETPSDYRRSFLDARQCVRALRALGRDGVLSSDGDGLEQLLLQATDTDRLISFVRHLIGPLQDHDARHRASLLTTLNLVFENSWNLHAAARAAHVHVSTLRYRLSRVEAIAGVDLRRPEDRLALQLALRTTRLLTASGRWPVEPSAVHQP
ncbi:MAG TPA: PocR ligand-binding domain-containing protein [Solirubrobacteraceae bacterium]|jgi:ligand-binding sensor protein/GAF domain-containing protein